MNFFLKQKFWFFTALFFIVVTITLLIGIFCQRHKHHGRHEGGEDRHRPHRRDFKRGPNFSITEYLAKELAFSPEQKTKLEVLNNRIEEKKDSLWQQNEKSKELFSEQLFSYAPNKLRQDSLITSMNRFTEAFNRTRIEQVEKIKALCTEDQKKKLQEALTNLNGFDFRKGRHHGGERGRPGSDSIQANEEHGSRGEGHRGHRRHDNEEEGEHRRERHNDNEEGGNGEHRRNDHEHRRRHDHNEESQLKPAEPQAKPTEPKKGTNA